MHQITHILRKEIILFILPKGKRCIPGIQDAERSKQDGKAIKQLKHLSGRGGFSLTGGCGDDLFNKIESKGAEPATMGIAFMDIPDRRYCLRIHFREGDYRLSVPSMPKRPSTNPGVPDDFDLTPADWQAYRTIF